MQGLEKSKQKEHHMIEHYYKSCKYEQHHYEVRLSQKDTNKKNSPPFSTWRKLRPLGIGIEAPAPGPFFSPGKIVTHSPRFLRYGN